MQGDPEVLEFLNEQLTGELTAINQYWLHYRIQDNKAGRSSPTTRAPSPSTR